MNGLNIFGPQVGIQENAIPFYYHDIDTSNTINGKPIYYLVKQHDMVLDGVDTLYVALISTINVTVKNINSNGQIALFNATQSTIDSCRIHDGGGIILAGSSHNFLKNVYSCNNYYWGFLIVSSSNNTIINCFSCNNSFHSSGFFPIMGGFNFYVSDDNIIRGNTISNNPYGIEMMYCNGNTINENNISLNTISGLYVLNSSGNAIYHNNFIGNVQNAYDNGVNTWDDGTKGNYWNDYKEKYPDAQKVCCKGIWDTPYDIPDGENKDGYPLVKQWPSVSALSIKIFNFNLILFQRFPNAFPILRQLLGY
jgi:parallel beta-helix repeat protein